LDPGTYRLQNLLYDYFFKCYFRGGNLDEGLPRVKAQLFDWFVPKYYHQTTRMELCSMIDMLGGSSDKEIISKTNGHFFKIINQHC
jgi:hypothetical protein